MGILSRNKFYAARSTPYQAARTFSSSRISPDSQPLSLISFGSKITRHWALFLPYPQTPFYGTIWHFAEADSDNNERTMRSSSKFFWLPRRSHIVKQREGWNLRQGDGKCIDIGWALSTPDIRPRSPGYPTRLEPKHGAGFVPRAGPTQRLCFRTPYHQGASDTWPTTRLRVRGPRASSG
jgi:hypothetical protein